MFRTFPKNVSFMQTFTLASSLLMTSNSFAFSNHAATFCVNNGGDRQVITTQTGRIGVCYLGGAIIEEWTLMRGAEGNKSLQALVAYYSDKSVVNALMGNPASGNCIRQGGEGVFGKNQSGGEIGMCKFSDGSMIEEWTLYFGFASSTNDELNRVLNTGT